MAGEYGNDYITLTDEEGNEIELEHLDTLEYNGETYMAFIPAEETKDGMPDDSAELIILKTEEGDGEEMLVTLEDENELQAVFELFLARFEEEDGEEEYILEEDEENEE